jgi:hypothetical protein
MELTAGSAEASYSEGGVSMIAYGIYGLLLLAGLLVLGLVVLRSFSGQDRREIRSFVLLRIVLLFGFAFLMAQVLVPLLNLQAGLVISVLAIAFACLALLSLISLSRDEVKLKVHRKQKQENRIRGLVKQIEAAPNDVDGYVSLARILEDAKMYNEAKGAYHYAWKACPRHATARAVRLKQKESMMARLAQSAGDVRVVICAECESKARPEQRLCLRCGSPLYRNDIEWVWKSLPLGARIVGCAVVAVSLAYITWVPIAHSLGLMGTWLAVVSYLSLEWEVFA